MCGGLIAAAAPRPNSMVFYHLGRGLGYGALGATAGTFGAYTLGEALSGVIPWLIAFALSFGFILLGVLAWKGPPHLKMPSGLSGFYARLWGRVMSQTAGLKRAATVGFLSAFLPCGWLYAFVLAAIAAKSALFGSLILFAFWLGTLPALSVAPLFLRKLLRPLSRIAPRLPALLLIGLGIFTLGMKFAPLFLSPTTGTGPVCAVPHSPKPAP